jgi:hypothetical protein
MDNPGGKWRVNPAMAATPNRKGSYAGRRARYRNPDLPYRRGRCAGLGRLAGAIVA